MSNLVRIGTSDLTVKKFKGQKVITLKDVDIVHHRADGTAKRNFRSNRKHFIENEDFFLVKPTASAKDEFRPLNIPPKGIIFLTESGYLMLVKSFTDDLAWEVQRKLVKCYFRVKHEQQQLSAPTQKHYKGVPVVTLTYISVFL